MHKTISVTTPVISLLEKEREEGGEGKRKGGKKPPPSVWWFPGSESCRETAAREGRRDRGHNLHRTG